MGTNSLAYTIVDSIFWIYMMMLVVRILSSWFAELQDHPIIRFIGFYTDPYLNFFRRFIPPLGIIDLSPIVAYFALMFIELIVKGILFR
jgi:YggT family protein